MTYLFIRKDGYESIISPSADSKISKIDSEIWPVSIKFQVNPVIGLGL